MRLLLSIAVLLMATVVYAADQLPTDVNSPKAAPQDGNRNEKPADTSSATLLSIISVIISMGSAVCALYSLFLQRRNAKLSTTSFVDDHGYRRKSAAIQLLAKWDEQTLGARKVIMSKWERRFNDNSTIEWALIEAYQKQQLAKERRSGRLDSKPRLITDHMAVVLNYFELIAVAIEHHVVEEDILRNQFHATFQRWNTILADFRRHLTITRGNVDPYNGALDRLEKRWYPPQEPPPQTRTGVPPT